MSVELRCTIHERQLERTTSPNGTPRLACPICLLIEQ